VGHDAVAGVLKARRYTLSGKRCSLGRFATNAGLSATDSSDEAGWHGVA
jgi:hypothetical protein